MDSEPVTLDPEDWDAFANLVATAAGTGVAYLRDVRERPVWQPVPEAVRDAFAEPLPSEGEPLERLWSRAVEQILPFATGNIHPRFFGWVHGAGMANGLVADILAAAMNSNVGGRDHGAVYVERQVIDWCRQMFGFGEAASGLLTSGTSMATLIALTVARNRAAGSDVRRDGLWAEGAPLVGYTSAEAHGSVAKAFEILGLGSRRLRRVEVDHAYRMNPQALARAIAEDRQDGCVPFCVIGTAGTVNTGALDDLSLLADVCRDQGLWLHVDGAFGALAVLSPEHRGGVRGIERADSLAFDFHKWAHVGYDAGCVLVRDGALHHQTFVSANAYLAPTVSGLAGGAPWFCEFGPELSRGFRALKVWFALKEHGLRRLGDVIERHCRLARRFAEQVEQEPRLELMAPVSLNIVCLRFTDPGRSPGDLDRINSEIVVSLQNRGLAAPSTTRLQGQTVIRMHINNHRTRSSDMDAVFYAILETADDIVGAADGAAEGLR